MTESEWSTCTEVDAMLGAIHGRIGERKLRLFGAACCRQVWRYLRDEESRRAVEMAEAFAEGGATDADLRKARRDARGVSERLAFEAGLMMSLRTWARRDAVAAAVLVAETRISPDAIAAKAREAITSSPDPPKDQCSILRCILGPLPFRTIAPERGWLGGAEGTVEMMAGSIALDRAFHRMPYLGDALEEGGCTDIDILEHCRHRGEHFRGCWVLDLILGKA